MWHSTVAALEDKIVQKAVVDNILTPIYEAEFLGFSYGFRPGRGAHDALDALAVGIERRKINWILDADVSKYFDRIERGRLMELLEIRIGDRRLKRLIGKWLISERSDINQYGNLENMGTFPWNPLNIMELTRKRFP